MKRLFWGVVVGVLLAPVAARAQTEDVVYYHTDAIGSVRMITDANGAVIDRYDYLPFGELWGLPPTSPDPRQFAAKERDAETGLDYFGARYHRSLSGRFTTVDPLLDIDNALGNPQLWNRYAYGLNNPLKFTDNDGRSATLVGGLIGAAVGGGAALIQGRSWRDIGASAGGGAVSGAMLGSVIDTGGASLPVLLGAGAMAGVGGRLVENSIGGRATTAQDVALSGLAGGAGVAAGQIMIVGAQTASRTAIDTTAHGAVRIAGQGAMRGGTLSAAEITSVRGAYGASYTSNVNGATALVARTANGRFNVVIEGRGGYMTSYRTISQKDLNRLARKYEWGRYEPK